MVPHEPTRPALAHEPRPLSDLGCGGYAAADSHRCCSAVLQPVPENISQCSVTRPRAPTESAADVVGAWILQSGAEPAPCGEGDRRARWGSISPNARGDA